MLERHWCDCGYEIEREYDPGWFRWKCPKCRTLYTIMAGPEPTDKTGRVFQEAIRRLERRDAEGAAQAAGQFYELWLKLTIRALDADWLSRQRSPNVPLLLNHLERTYKLAPGTLRGINRSAPNRVKHDSHYTMKTAEAVAYVDSVVTATWDTFMCLIGKNVWERGEAGELDIYSSGDSEQHWNDFFSYHRHYRLGIVGPVMWTRTWWTAFRAGRTDWYKVPWTGRPRPSRLAS